MNVKLIQRALELLPHLQDAEVQALLSLRGGSRTPESIGVERQRLKDGLEAALAGNKNPIADLFLQRAKAQGVK